MIRWLALLLVLVNVAVFAWRYELRLREARDAPAAPPPLSPDLPRLRLLSELDVLPPLREEAAAAEAPVTAEPADPPVTATTRAALPPAVAADAATGDATVEATSGVAAAGIDASVAAADAAADAAGSQVTAAGSAQADPSATGATETNDAAQPPDLGEATAEATRANDTASSATRDEPAGAAPDEPSAAERAQDANPQPATVAAAVSADTTTSAAAAPPAADAAAAPRPAATSETPEAPTFTTRAGTSSGVAAETCIEIGPFPNGKDADALEAWLAPRALSLVRVNRVMRRRQFFWVYLEPRDAEEAREKLADLRARGVQDFLLIQRGGLRNAISLGLFSTQDAVGRRLAEMNAQGFQPVVVPRIDVTDHDWVRASLAVGYTDTGSIPGDRLAGATVNPIDCAQIAAAMPGP